MALVNRRLLRKPLQRTLIVLIRLLMPSAGCANNRKITSDVPMTCCQGPTSRIGGG